jgi:hypothetical protein
LLFFSTSLESAIKILPLFIQQLNHYRHLTTCINSFSLSEIVYCEKGIKGNDLGKNRQASKREYSSLEASKWQLYMTSFLHDLLQKG